MKIFYSWQSDTPGKTGHYLIRNALQEAIDDMVIDEAERLELDHDTKGVMGSPAIFETILDKIDACDVFVADVSIVGKTPADKQIINPNVAIELGYALKSKGFKAIVLIMNDTYGGGDALPFDLRHRRWPTMFTLSDDADKKACDAAQKKLAGTLKPILEEYKKVHRSETQELFSEAKITISPAHYFKPDEPLVKFSAGHGSKKLYGSAQSMLYLRIFPKFKVAPLKAHEAYDFMQPGTIQPLSSKGVDYVYTNRNENGAIWHSGDWGRYNIVSAAKLFKTCEIWSFDSYIPSANGNKTIPSQKYEDALKKALKSYLNFAHEKLGYKLPVIVEAGMSNAKGYKMAMGNGYFFGPVTREHIQKRCELSSWDETAVNTVLLNIFDEFFDACGEPRPENLNGFPAVSKV